MVPIIVDLDTDDYTHMSNKVNKYIVIHYTGNATDTARNNAKYFKNGKRNASAHYFVDANEIVQIVKDSDASWGVGKKYGNARLWGKCTNANSINIEMCSTNGKIDDATMKNTADLVRSLMARYNIPIQNVVRHYDVCAKRCPGWDGWLPNNESEWNRLIAMIQNTVPTSAEERQLVPVPQPSGVSGVLYKVTTPALNVRKDPNASSAKRGCIRDMGTYTITEICGNWGKLASGLGWICLDYAKRVGGVEPTPQPTPTPQPAPKSNYSVGSVYTLTTNLRVRTGAGTNNPAKTRNQLTAGGRAHANANGSLVAGTQVTCQETKTVGNETWIRIPSGWVCAIQNGNVYIR
jgi:hypothetical protein